MGLIFNLSILDQTSRRFALVFSINHGLWCCSWSYDFDLARQGSGFCSFSIVLVHVRCLKFLCWTVTRILVTL